MLLEKNTSSIPAKYENWNISFEIDFWNPKYIGKRISMDLYYWEKVNDCSPVNHMILEKESIVEFMCSENNHISFPLVLKQVYKWKKIDIIYEIQFHIENTFLLFDSHKNLILSIQNHNLDVKKLIPSIEIISNLNLNDILNGRLSNKQDTMNRTIIFQTFFQENKSSILYGSLLCIGLFLILDKFIGINNEFFQFLSFPLILFMLVAYNKIIKWFIKFTMNSWNFLKWKWWGSVISWTITKDLTDLQIKILLKNIEKWIYTRRSWRNNKNKNIYFSEEVSNKVLFEENYWFIAKWTSFESLLLWKTIHLDYLGENLFNSIWIDGKNNYWLYIYLEVQIINSVYADIMTREIVYLDDTYFKRSQWTNEWFNI